MSEKMKNFEESLARLEGLVKQLESDLPIDQATKAFEEGIQLSKACMDALKEEKGKMSILIDDLNKLTEEITID